MSDSVDGIRALLAQNHQEFDQFNDRAGEQLPVVKEMLETAGPVVNPSEAFELDYVATLARPRVAEFIRRTIAARGSSQPLRDAFQPPLIKVR